MLSNENRGQRRTECVVSTKPTLNATITFDGRDFCPPEVHVLPEAKITFLQELPGVDSIDVIFTFPSSNPYIVQDSCGNSVIEIQVQQGSAGTSVQVSEGFTGCFAFKTQRIGCFDLEMATGKIIVSNPSVPKP